MEKILTTEDATPTPAAEVKSIFTLTVLSDGNIKVDASSNEVRMDAIPDAAIKWYLFNVYNQYKEMFRKEAGLDEDKFRLTEEQVNKIRQVTYFVTKAQLFDAFHKVTGQYDEQEFNNMVVKMEQEAFSKLNTNTGEKKAPKKSLKKKS